MLAWLGMLPATFVIVNVGTELSELESPAGLLSWQMLVAFALLGVMPLVLRKVVAAFQRERR